MIDLYTVGFIGAIAICLTILICVGTSDEILDRIRMGLTFNTTFILGATALYAMNTVGILNALDYSFVMCGIFIVSFCATCLMVGPNTKAFHVMSRRYNK